MHGPFVNINGTSREELIAQTKRIRDAATELRAALSDGSPHGRDYQTVDSSIYAADNATWRAMLLKLKFIEREYEGVMERLLNDH